jgi:glutamate-1-semialdehyde 2,1-aminomutase
MAGAYEKFEEKYKERTPKSRELYEDAQTHLPGGVPNNAGFRSPYPVYMKEAHGAYIFDLDDNEYVDLMIGGGPQILGHGHPAVVAAAQKQVALGTNLIAPNPLVVELAKKIKEHMDGMEMVRFVNSGSEATHMALRAARAFTGRQKIAKFEGNFHGQFDNLLIGGTQISGPEDTPDANPQGAGIPDSVIGDTVVLPFNDAEAAAAGIKEHAGELAAVILEPVAGTWLGGISAEPAFLDAVRRVTEEEGILLIYDEVITGFRLGLGGATSVNGVVPDMRAMGKAIGGGFPCGAFGGRADVMSVIAPATQPHETDKAYQSGTFSGNPVSSAAGLAMIAELEKPGVYERMDGHSERIRSRMTELGRELGIPVQAVGEGSIFGVFFAKQPPRNIRDVARADSATAKAFFMGLVANGVYVTPFHLGFTNAAQTDGDIDRVLDASELVLREIKASGP